MDNLQQNKLGKLSSVGDKRNIIFLDIIFLFAYS